MNEDHEAATAAFRRLDLPKAAWTHRAHLAAGLWFVLHHGIGAARTEVPAAIRRYNAAVGTLDTPTSGYHETITQLYLTLIDEWVRDWTGPAGYSVMAPALVEALDDRRIPLRYYSEARLWSAEARATWLEPDHISGPSAPFGTPAPGLPPPEPSTAG